MKLTNWCEQNIRWCGPKKQLFEECVLWISGWVLLGYLFYHRFWIGLLGIPTLPLFMQMDRQHREERELRQLRESFGSYLHSVSADVSSGHSLEHALRHGNRVVEAEYGNSSPVVICARKVEAVLSAPNCSAEEALLVWQREGKLPEIALFAETCALCAKSGADLQLALRKVQRILTNRLETEREIQSILAQKRLESNLLTAIPLLLLLLLQFSSSSYLAPLYETARGRIWMTAAWMAMGGSYVWSVQITKAIFAVPSGATAGIFGQLRRKRAANDPSG